MYSPVWFLSGVSLSGYKSSWIGVVGFGFEQPGLLEGAPAHDRGTETG